MLRETLVICEKELRSMSHSPTDRILRLIRPMIWLILFGSVFKLQNVTGVNYQQFMLPGILVNTLVVSAISHGITLKWESDLGILSRLLAAPVARTAIVLGKALSSVAKASIEGILFLIFAWFLQIKFYPEVTSSLLSAVVLSVFVIGVSSWGMILAILLKSKEAYTGVVGLIATPSLFASNSLYNLNQMPQWLQFVAELNPATYAVDSIRRLLIYRSMDPGSLAIDVAVLLFFSACSVIFTALVFSRIGRR